MTSKRDFCHLHVHTDSSVLDGIIKTGDLCKHVKASGMSSCGISDHGVLHATVDFYKKAKENNIKPILGVEAYLTDDEDDMEKSSRTRDNYHCVLIAENEIGLRNLFWLTNKANINNFYYKPRISIRHLEGSRSEGIIATTSCLGGIVSKRGVFNKDSQTFDDVDKKATKSLERFASIFNNKLYLEIQDNPEFWQQDVYNSWLISRARDMRLPLIITSDAHYLNKEDKAVHDLVMAQQLKIPLSEYQEDSDGLRYGAGHYIRSAEEMYQAAIKLDAEDSFWNTTEIANKCNVNIELGKYQTPVFDPKKESDYNEFQKWRAKKNECHPSAN